jgi:hypothetical protein
MALEGPVNEFCRVQVFVTRILSTPKLRSDHGKLKLALAKLPTPYQELDVAYDDDARALWKKLRKGLDATLPFVIVDGRYRPGVRSPLPPCFTSILHVANFYHSKDGRRDCSGVSKLE